MDNNANALNMSSLFWWLYELPAVKTVAMFHGTNSLPPLPITVNLHVLVNSTDNDNLKRTLPYYFPVLEIAECWGVRIFHMITIFNL